MRSCCIVLGSGSTGMFCGERLVGGLGMGQGLALAIDMRKELLECALSLDRRRGAMIVCSLAPPAIAGWRFRGLIERRLGGPRSIAAGLLGGGAAMALAGAR